jgi:Cu(I)/Ag(I) efflux system membrane fusion protein
MLHETESPEPKRSFGGGLALGLLAGLLLGAGLLLALRPTAQVPVKAEAKAFQCPMHPQIIQDHPGACPICGMDLVAMEASTGPQSPGPEGMVTVQITPERQQLIGLRTVKVEEGNTGGELRTSGRVVVDERRVHKLALRVEGYVQSLDADFLGRPFRKGERLMELHSPEFAAAQGEFLAALQAQRKLGATEQGPRYQELVETARRRLRFLGAASDLVESLERGGEIQRSLIVLAPSDGILTAKSVSLGSKVAAMDQPLELTDLGVVWVLADLYESDLGRVRVGMGAEFEVPALGKRFQGRVSFLEPTLDPKTRTLRARLELANPGLALRPEMLGEVRLQVPGKRGLRVPVDAILDSGTRKIAFVDVGQGYFEPREVKTGLVTGERVEVLEGLAKGEAVVTGAAFLVDSESRLRAAVAQMSGGPK